MIRLLERQRLEIRDRVMQIVEHEMPRLVRLPVAELVRGDDWFIEAGLAKILKIYVFPAFRLGVFSGKLLPARQIWLDEEAAGAFKDRPTVISATSGNYGKDSGLIAPGFNVRDFIAVVNFGTPRGKINHLLASRATVKIAPQGVSSIEYADHLAERHGYHGINQYTHEGSVKGHQRTMVHISNQMAHLGEPEFIFGGVAGTCSTLTAAHRYLRPLHRGKVKVLGVASMSKREKVPGSRSPEDLAELKKIGGFPHRAEWAEVLDFPLVSSVTKQEAFVLNAEIVQQMYLPVGPTGALLLAGVYHFLRQHVYAGTIDCLRNRDGNIVFVLLWMDSYMAYLDDPEYAAFFRS
jgi:cysteine synthase